MGTTIVGTIDGKIHLIKANTIGSVLDGTREHRPPFELHNSDTILFSYFTKMGAAVQSFKYILH